MMLTTGGAAPFKLALRRLAAPIGATALLMCAAAPALAQDVLAGVIPGANSGMSVKSQILVLMTLLGLLPVLALMMTSFTRFVIVLSLLRQALGLQQGLPNRIDHRRRADPHHAGDAPDRRADLYRSASCLRPRTDHLEQALKTRRGAAVALHAGPDPQERAGADRRTWPARPQSPTRTSAASASSCPPSSLSELKTAFQIGCMLFVPFLIIDLVVSTVLIAMGMMMLSPLVISLPFKLLLFVLVDGWTLTVQTLVGSIHASIE